MRPQQGALVDALRAQFVGRGLVFDRLTICRSSRNLPIADWECLVDYPLAPADAAADPSAKPTILTNERPSDHEHTPRP